MTFRFNFGIDFSIFFEMAESVKYVKSITPNVVLSHQKPLIFALIFHAIFMFFPNQLPEGIFRGSKCPSIIKGTILVRPLISRGAENGPIIPNNISKNDKKGSRANYGDPLGADLGAIWRRKRSKDEVSSIWGRFFIDLGWIFNKFRLMFDVVVQAFDAILR